MANLAGFIPQPGPGAVYGGNWSQDYGDVMNTLVEAQRAQQQNQFAHSPFGGSFNRRFGGAMPAGLSGAMPQQQEAMPNLAALQGALAQATGGAQMMDASNGSLQSQPWYDEYLSVAQAGGQLPMVHGGGGPLTGEEQRGITERRQQRLENGRAGLLPMEDRRANVRENALADSEQRKMRMGKLDPDQVRFNQLSRLQGGLGGPLTDEAQFEMDAARFGLDVALDNRKLRMAGQDAQANRDFQGQLQRDQIAAANQRAAEDRAHAEALQQGDHQFRGQEGEANRQTTMTAAESEAALALERLKLQMEQQWRQMQMEQQNAAAAREAAAQQSGAALAADTQQHQESMGLQRELNSSDNAVQMAKIAQEQELMRQQRIAALLADPTFLPEMPRDRRQLAAEQQIPAASVAAPQSPGGQQVPLAAMQGPLGMANPVRDYALEELVKAPATGSKGFDRAFIEAKQQYPDLDSNEFAALWEKIRGYNPYSPAGEYPLIPGMMYDKLEGDAFPEYASDVRSRRLNRVLGYEPGEGLPKMAGMAMPPGIIGVLEMLRSFGGGSSPQQPQQPPVASHNKW